MNVKDVMKTEERRQAIVQAAQEIILEEGVSALSIRKISAKLNQTPGIIYHYFKNKDDILFHIIKTGYASIMQVIMKNKRITNIELRIRQTLSDYIYAMIQQESLYTILMNSQHPILKQQSEILRKGIGRTRGSMHELCNCLQAGVDAGIFEISQIEVQAQLIWCSMYGIVDRCIKEHPDPELRDALILSFLDMIVVSIKRRT